MRYNGIEFYDSVDFTGGGANYTSSKYLVWMVANPDNNIYNNDIGLYVTEFYFSFDNYKGNDIWVNFELAFCETGTNPELLSGGYIVPIYPQYKNISFINEKVLSIGYNTESYYLGKDRSFENPYYGLGYSIGTNMYNRVFYKYHIHFYDGKIYYYKENSLVLTKEFGSLDPDRYFGIIHILSSRSWYSSNPKIAVKNISITDSMTNILPKLPYTLGEKDNEVYGYKKQSE